MLQRLGVILLVSVVLMGLLGVFGMRTRSVSAEADGYQLTVVYSAVSRAGIDTPWRVVVHHPGGFDRPVTLATTADYFDIFEAQGFRPTPSAETATGEYLFQEYDPPPGEELRVDFDAYIQPASQRGQRASTVLIVDGREITRVSYRTVLFP
jgi:hypothetical protein